jgi:hypothetical protein
VCIKQNSNLQVYSCCVSGWNCAVAIHDAKNAQEAEMIQQKYVLQRPRPRPRPRPARPNTHKERAREYRHCILVCDCRLICLEELPRLENVVRYLYHDRESKTIRIFHQQCQTNLLQHLKRTRRKLLEDGMSKPVLEADEIIRYDVVLLLLYETTIDSYASLSLSLSLSAYLKICTIDC